jgi:hypothetical protein
LEHDIAGVDFRLEVERAVSQEPWLTLDTWIPESAFWTQMDEIVYERKDLTGKRYQTKKGIRPDGYFVIIDEERRATGLKARARFLVEIDRAKHGNPKFGLEKVVVGADYIMSPAYKARFGDNAGRWLVVTTSAVRMKNLMHQTSQTEKSRAFWFTTVDHTRQGNVLTAPIWWQVGDSRPQALFPNPGRGKADA